MKCDIEINITSECDDYESIEIPECLRNTSLESLSDSVKENGIVSLPDRYAKKLRKPNENTEIANGHDCISVGNDLVSREQDLTIALQWIKQEIVSF